jgi:sugar/nucleoside kinase (ribokinase family)
LSSHFLYSYAMIQPQENQTICIIGNLNIDLIIRDVPAMPVWGQEVIGTSRLQVSSGQAGYLAFALRRLSIPTCLIGNVGEDLYGRQILSELRASGVDTSGTIVTRGGNTGITVAIVRIDGERAFVSDLGCLKNFNENAIQSNWNLVETASVVCLVGLFCLPGLSLQAAARQLDKAREVGKVTMLDTGWDSGNWPPETLVDMRTMLKQVSLFMPNWDEARAITQQATVENAAKALQEMGPETVVVKCGEKGSYALRGSQACWVPPRPVHVFDAVGAGDVFNSGFLFGFLRNWSLEACLAMGNTTASLYISRQEDRFPGLAEVAIAAQDYPVLAAIHDLQSYSGRYP